MAGREADVDVRDFSATDIAVLGLAAPTTCRVAAARPPRSRGRRPRGSPWSAATATTRRAGRGLPHVKVVGRRPATGRFA